MAKDKNTSNAQADAPKPAKPELVRKVTLKTMGLDKATLLKLVMTDEKSDHAVARIIGRVTRCEPVTTDQGTSVRFKGIFKGINLLDGSVYQGASCFLPKSAEELVEGALAGDDKIKSIDVAFDIAVRYDADAATSYVFVTVPLVEPETENDPLAILERKLPAPAALAIEHKAK